MGELVADYILKRLREWGVHRVYGYPGDGINGFLGAFDRADGDPEFIQARHEEMAAFMACGHAKFTGEARRLHRDLRPGRDPPPERPLRREARPRARSSRSSASRSAPSLGGDYQQEVDLQVALQGRLASTSRSAWCPGRRATSSTARSGSRSTGAASRRLIVPNDVAGGEGGRVAAARRTARSTRASATRARASLPQDEPTSQRAADVLNEGEKVAILVGQGAPRRRATSCSSVADLLGAGRRQGAARQGRRSPTTCPFVTGSIGLLGTTAELRADERAATRC